MPRYRYRASSARVRVHPSIEFLENRCVPSVAPVWVPQGPGPNTQGEVQGMPLQNNPVTGAINSFALDATNANIAFAGAASGGIWRTFNAQSLVPSWTPLTDSMPTLSIGDIAFSPLDANTLYAGTGSFSNGSFGTFAGVANGGDGLGVLKTTDLGNHWTLYSTIVDPVTGQTTTFQDQNLKIRSIVPTEQVGPQGQIVLAGAVSENDDGGVYLSQDGGQTWERLSNTGSGISASGLPNGDVLSIVADPANPSLIYAAVPGDRNMMNPDAGIYRSLDGGLTWTALSLSTALLGDIQAADNVKLAIHNDAANDVVYALVGTIGTNKTAEESVYQSANTGGTWVLMGSNFSGQTSLPQLDTDPQTSNNLTIAADPFLATRVFVAGSGTGEVHYGDFDPQTQNTTWSLASGSGANGNPPGGTPQPTVVHSDSRTMKFDAAGNLWESDDGGVYRLVNPDATSSDQRYWVSENGDIQAAEFYAADYDSVNHTVFAGAQDNGADLQLVPNGVSWLMTFFADSTHVAVDNTSLASSGETYLYAVNSNLSDMRRFTVDSNNNIIDDCLVGLGTQESSMGCVPLSEKGSPPSPEYLGGLNDAEQNASGAFVPFVLNATDPRSLVIGLNGLYESVDTAGNMPGDVITNITPAMVNGEFTALAYGGMAGGAADAGVLYAGTEAGELFLRTSGTGTAPTRVMSYPGKSAILSIALDPANWQTAYVVDVDSHVWMTTTAGMSWTDISGNLPSQVSKLRTVEVFRPPGVTGPAYVLVAGLGGTLHDGGVFLTLPGSTTTPVWAPVGLGLPNVQVQALHYDATDDVLVAGTFGRGAWTIPSFSHVVSIPLAPNAAFVESLYIDLLHRVGNTTDPTDAGAWVNALNSGSLTPAAVADRIGRSPEALGVVVDGLYLEILGRPSDPGGRITFVNLLESGSTIEQAVTAMVTSLEYTATTGSATAFVQSLYNKLLGRTGSNSEIAYWVGVLPQLGRGGVALDFLGSTEFRTDVVEELYGFPPPSSLATLFPNLLHRTSAPSAGEVNYWVTTGLDVLTIETLFAGSAEFFNDAGQPAP